MYNLELIKYSFQDKKEIIPQFLMGIWKYASFRMSNCHEAVFPDREEADAADYIFNLII